MKLFLDENITPKAKSIFINLGYDVESIVSYHKQGISDEEVFKLALKEGRALITQNGKDFIVQIPPRMMNIKHFGLIWLRVHVTRKNVENICGKIDFFLKQEITVSDSIWKVKQDDVCLCFHKRYPPPTKIVSC